MEIGDEQVPFVVEPVDEPVAGRPAADVEAADEVGPVELAPA